MAIKCSKCSYSMSGAEIVGCVGFQVFKAWFNDVIKLNKLAFIFALFKGRHKGILIDHRGKKIYDVLNDVCYMYNKTSAVLIDLLKKLIAGGANEHKITCPICCVYSGWVPEVIDQLPLSDEVSKRKNLSRR